MHIKTRIQSGKSKTQRQPRCGRASSVASQVAALIYSLSLFNHHHRHHQTRVECRTTQGISLEVVSPTAVCAFSTDYNKMISVARPSVLRAVRSQLHPSRPIFDVRLSALTRLLSTLAVLEQRGGKLSASSLSAIAAAQKLGGSITGFVAGSGVKASAAAEAAKIKGVEKIVAVDNEAYEKVR